MGKERDRDLTLRDGTHTGKKGRGTKGQRARGPEGQRGRVTEGQTDRGTER